MLLQVLSTISSRNDHRNKLKPGRAHYPGICIAAALVLKERNQRMTGLQSVIALILFASHVDKQVPICTAIVIYFLFTHVHLCGKPLIACGVKEGWLPSTSVYMYSQSISLHVNTAQNYLAHRYSQGISLHVNTAQNYFAHRYMPALTTLVPV